MEKIMKLCLVLFVLAMVLWGLDSMDFSTSTQKIYVYENTKTENIQIPEKVSVENKLYWIPKDHILCDGFMDELLNTKNFNRNIIFNKISTRGIAYELNFYGKKITVISIDTDKLSFIGTADTINETITINLHNLEQAYNCTNELLRECFLQNEICSKESFCEAIFMQELWHIYNENIEPKMAEYLSEYPSLESQAKNFYLTMKFYENTSLKETKTNNPEFDYQLLRKAYKSTFEIDYPMYSYTNKVWKFKSLISKYGFNGLIQRYKDFK